MLQKVKYLYDVLDRIEKIQYNVNCGYTVEIVYSYKYDTQAKNSEALHLGEKQIGLCLESSFFFILNFLLAFFAYRVNFAGSLRSHHVDGWERDLKDCIDESALPAEPCRW